MTDDMRDASTRSVCGDDDSARPRVANILVVGRDEHTRALGQLLRGSGLNVVAARTQMDAMRLARQTRFDLIIDDMALGDASDADGFEPLRESGRRFIRISGFLAVDAMEPAARESLDLLKGLMGRDRVGAAVFRSRDDEPAGIAMPFPANDSPRSAAERWARYVLKACKAESDLKTLDSWAQQAAVSYTTLCANCRIMRIRPLDARDFMRVLRALLLASSRRHGCPPEVFLDVSDARTVRMLSLRAGVDLDSAASHSSIGDFFARQRFVAAHNQGLQLIRDVLDRSPLHVMERARMTNADPTYAVVDAPPPQT
jgi:CheY-like chemotaxis protein